ncbi:protein lifeguard 4 [Lates japonicus]|uniref:Protein lifeguard 4 n=1 Tax=Lates japonicus TaxID=270547 RepID=A0AAD3M5K5_LATJO|nr:protein lifeguard 4 [Lates japonicus]
MSTEKYPRSSIEDDFNYGTNVATASIQIRMGNESTELVLAGAGALVFCGFIIYDTHLLMKQLSPEEHILASINLYLDVVNLFLHILRVLDSMKKH